MRYLATDGYTVAKVVTAHEPGAIVILSAANPALSGAGVEVKRISFVASTGDSSPRRVPAPQPRQARASFRIAGGALSPYGKSDDLFLARK